MARFEIKSKNGNTIRYSGKPRYNGSYLKPAFIEFSEISSPTPIAWEVGDYLDYSRTGMRYYLYSIPQPSKKARSGANGGSFTYSNVQLFSATKDLEIALFRDLVSNDNNIHFSTSPDVATFENVEGIARRIQACLDDLYPGKWEIRLAEFSADEDAELIESISTAKDFALSGGTCLDALSKIYELWDNLGWIHSYENGKEVITIGYANKRIDANTTDSYLYGKGNGLTAIKKNQTNKDEFATRLYVYGSERNLPARYYNDKEILNAESVDIRNLMLPLDSWGKTNGLLDARKAYLENAEAVAKFGVIPKTHYFDSEDAGADIYPTIERLTIGEIRSVMQSTDEYYPTNRYADEDRADAISDAENPTDDGVINPNGKEYDAKSYLSIQSHSKTINMVGGLQTSPLLTDYLFFSKVVTADIERAKVVVDLDETITIPDRGFSSVSAKLMIGDDEQAGYGTAVGSTTLVGVKSADGKNWEIKLGRVSAEYGKSEFYDNNEYHIYGHISITANTIGVESGEITIKFGAGSGSIGLKRILDKTFRLRLKQIGFNINDQASLGNGKTISMKTGACAGRNFVISSCTYSSALDAWTITCKRQQDDTLGMLFPNNAYEITEGDTFVLLDIAMPELYVSVAQNRLLAEGQKLLSRASKIQSNYEPSVDAKVMVESGRNLREGMFMEISDEDVVDGTTDYILIDSLSIYEDESAIPTYKVTLREKKKVSYKGTPSATSANDTKSVEDETEEQVNVDLSNYVKKDVLAAMWSLDADGNLVTEKQVIVKNNIIISGDTSTGGTGQDVPSGIDEAQLKEYLDTNKYITSDYAYSKEEVNRLIDEVNAGDIDLTNYYTKEEVNSKISDLNISQYATKASLETLQGEVGNIESVLGMNEEAEGVINTWNEVKAFLAEIQAGEDLAWILNLINIRIDDNETAIDLIDGRVTKNEEAIADNVLETAKIKSKVSALISDKADWGTTLAHYGITDAYTKAEVANELAKYLLLESANQTIKGNITIEGNLIVTGDTASGAKGSEGGVAGTLLGIKVNGTTYDKPVNGILTIPDYPTSLEWSAINGKPTNLTEFTNDAGFITSAALNGYAKTSDLPTKSSLGLANVENKSSATIRGEITSANVTNALGYTPLSTAGGTMSAGIEWSNNIRSWNEPVAGFELISTTNENVGYYCGISANGYYGMQIRAYGGANEIFEVRRKTSQGWQSWRTIYHTGNFNPADYLPLSGGKTITGTVTFSASAPALKLYRASGTPYIRFGASSSSEYGELGVSDNGNLVYWSLVSSNVGYNKWNAVIHSGNIGSQKVERARYIETQAYDGSKWYADEYRLYAKWVNSNILGLEVEGGYPIRVNQATKLETARTIWGQSFDGTGNVSGDISLGLGYGIYDSNNRSAFSISSDNQINIGYGTAGANFNTNIHGASIIFKYGASRSWGMVMNTSGNVTIGASDLASTTSKLYVNGVARATGWIGSNVNISCDANGNTSGYGGEINRFGGGKLWIQAREGGLELGNSAGINFNGAVTMSSTLSVASGINISTAADSSSAHIGYKQDGTVIMRYNGNAYGNLLLSGGGGAMYFRPNGTTNASGQAMLNTNGELTVNGNLIVAGDTSSGSDIRFKDKLSDHRIALSDIAEAPLFTFTWNDREDDTIHLGSSAQYWEKVAPWLVKGEDFKTLDYSTLGVAIGISLANKTLNHEERIKILEKENEALKAEIRRIQYGS